MEIERTGSDAARPPYSHDDVAALHRPLVSPPAFVLDSPGPDLEGETQDVCGASATADMSPLLFGQSGTSTHAILVLIHALRHLGGHTISIAEARARGCEPGER